MEDRQLLIKKLTSGDIRSLARAISIVENHTQEGQQLLEELDIPLHVPVIGITGPPGAGKSTLLNALIREIILDETKKVAVIAVDPTSPFNMGALLGDRVRMAEHYLNPRVYIRSMGSRGSLGGLTDKIMEVTDVCRSAGFDYIFIETVGVGQSEVEIAGLADITAVVLVPESGDEVQTMKAGLMEIADIFVVNKADRDQASVFYQNLFKLVKHKASAGEELPVLKTNAQEAEGIDELLKAIEGLQAAQKVNPRKAKLLAIKALTLIKSCRTEDIRLDSLAQQIDEKLQTNDFQLYRFVKAYC